MTAQVARVQAPDVSPAYKCEVSVLVIDDNPSSVELLSNAIAQPGLQVLTASDPEHGFDLFCRQRPQIVLTDVVMPRMSGLEVLERIMEVDPATDVILISGHYSAETAVEAVWKGASDYLLEPILTSSLRERIARLVEEARKRRRAQELEDELRSNSEFEGIVGRSPQMWDMFRRIRRIAPHYRTALITGETGTGKDLVARAIHKLSPVATGRYVVLNCSAVVETLFESELFGHVKGSFTGATQDTPGLFEHAHGGTLFLDEIGDMPLATQAKLLRVLQDQEVQRVGSLHARKVDVHVIAATNRDLRAAVAEGCFREDLFYRLSMVEIQVPPLAQRKEDLPLLQKHFIRRFAAQYGKQLRGLTHLMEMRLSQHSWPGNVRELENAIGHAAMMCQRDMLDVPDLPPALQRAGVAEMALEPVNGSGTLADVERQYIIRVLRETGGVISVAAGRLGVPRTTLNGLMRKLKISRNDLKIAADRAVPPNVLSKSMRALV
jgi:two-component system, NtrC family, response regulator HydG